MTHPKIVVMGVSGSGKSLVGQRLGQQLGVPFFDADDYHSPANVKKMANGIPLNDDDRREWLSDLAALIRDNDGLVLACSALKRVYRDQLRAGDPALQFVYLKGDFDTIWSRHSRRQDHYFNGQAMLESQFAALEEPGADEAIVVDINQTPEAILMQCQEAIAERD
ncbi:gluconokinase [Marinobacter sp. JSM 1782161]|uniref:gluconokinase n=1 Tax=Marinobacter sp. JSM 1782161 TaxID=2685906 RepID=UPI0014027885|nr:gluconokinase [Marinobacter sp. JSM 1782161]